MKIKMVELSNHINFKHLKIDNLNQSDIITLSGANGSGKSFLINTLHPYSTSNRYVKHYSIIPNEVGFKRIVYAMPNGDDIEIMHEYTPSRNGNTHSCKSYINIIKSNGEKKELNPTGHNEVFKDMVQKYLSFDNKVFGVSCISFKSNGITSTSSTDRFKILSNIVRLDNVRKFGKRATETFKDYNYTLKVLGNQYPWLYNSDNQRLVDMTDEIENVQKSIKSLEVKMEKDIVTLSERKKALGELEKITEHNRDEIMATGKVLSNFSDSSKTLREYYDEYQSTDIDIKNGELELSNIDDKLNNIKTMELMKEQLDQEKAKLENANKFKSKYISDAIRISLFTEDELNDSDKLNSCCNDLNSYVNYTIRPLASLVRSCPAVYTTESLSELLRDKQERVNSLLSLITKYETYLEMSDGNDYSVPYADNCNRCSIYDKFVKSSEFIKNNELSFKNARVDITEEKSDLGTIQNIITISHNFGDIPRKYIKEDYLVKIQMNSVLDFIKLCSQSSDEEDKIESIISLFKNIIEINKEISGIKDVIQQVNEWTPKTNAEDKEALLSRRKVLMNDMVRNADKYKMFTESGIGKLTTISKYGNESIITLRKLLASVLTYNQNKDMLTQEISELESSVSSAREDMSSYYKKYGELESSIKLTKEIGARAKETKAKLEIAKQFNLILNTDIPILLLKSKIEYLEEVVNSILRDNDINIAIHIIMNSDSYVIEADVNGVMIPDISMLSSGETALISLLLNSAILKLLGYNVMCLDEIDANLDTVNKKKFASLVYSIMSTLGIDQVICVSHNITSSIDNATKLLLGDGEGLDIDTSSMIRIK